MSAVINKFSINCSIQNLGFANMILIGGPFLVRFSYDRPVGNTYTRRSKQWVGDSFSLYRGRDTKVSSYRSMGRKVNFIRSCKKFNGTRVVLPNE